MTIKLVLPEITVGQAGKELTHNQALGILDQLVQARVADKDLSTPPGSPADGAMYIVGAAPTGAWSSKATQLAYWLSSVAAWSFIVPAAGWRVWVTDESKWYQYSGSAWVVDSIGNPPQCIAIAAGDEATAITAGANKVMFRMPFAFTLNGVRASLTTAQSSGAIFTVDINKSGTSVLSTKLTIDNAEKTSTTAATPCVISSSSLADDEEITIDVDAIGSGNAAGLKVYLIGTPV